MAASQGISDLWSGAEVAAAAEWHLLLSVVLIQHAVLTLSGHSLLV